MVTSCVWLNKSEIQHVDWMKPRVRFHWPVSLGCVPRSGPLRLWWWLLDASCPGLPFIVISRERSGSFSPEKEETVVLRGSQLGVCSRDPPSEYNRADHQEGLAWCKCACVHVCTHTHTCVLPTQVGGRVQSLSEGTWGWHSWYPAEKPLSLVSVSSSCCKNNHTLVA